MKQIIGIASLVLFASASNAQNNRAGSIKGTVIDAETLLPLIGANVGLRDTSLGAATDTAGTFLIDPVPVGSYTLLVSYLGYESVARADIIVKSRRINRVEISLNPSPLSAAEVVVEAGYFSQSGDQPISIIGLSAEEIRRAPGTAGDVSRVIFGLPAVAKVTDTKNSLIVRGGGPIETGFYVDNIAIPNINHFPEQGSSGGPIGLLNVDFIRDVNFNLGGFSPVYGNRLSSVMDISFRSGNRDEIDGQLDMSFAGFGGAVEGPLPGIRGSYLFSARRSFLDLIVKAIDEEESSVPQYDDVQGKVAIDLASNHKLSVLGLYAGDFISLSPEDALEGEDNFYSTFEHKTLTLGANWIYIWGPNGHSQTSFSNTTTDYDVSMFETRHWAETGEPKVVLDMRPTESDFKLRNVNRYRLSSSSAFDFGVEAGYTRAAYDNLYGEFTNALGSPIEAYRIDSTFGAADVGTFVNYQWRALPNLTLNTGLRIGYYSYTGNTHLSPRLSGSYGLSPTLSVNAAAGIFHQSIPLPLLVQNPGNSNLSDLEAYHVIVGFKKLLARDVQLTVEVYDKEYRHFPLDPSQPQLPIIDQVVRTSVYFNGQPLVDTGRAFSRGVELMLQKKLARNLYGLLGVAFSRSRYRDLDGVWRDRPFDNRITFQAEGGYKPNSKWEFSARWLYGGGRPYSPFDQEASAEAVTGILDVDRIYGERLPAYHALNVRFDRRWHFKGSNLIAYLSVWNAYGRENIAGYEWNEIRNEQETEEGWSLLPIFGLEFEF